MIMLREKPLGHEKRVEDAETAVQQKQDDIKHAEIVELTTREAENPVQVMLVAIGNSPCDHACSDDAEDNKDIDDKEAKQGKWTADY